MAFACAYLGHQKFWWLRWIRWICTYTKTKWPTTRRTWSTVLKKLRRVQFRAVCIKYRVLVRWTWIE